MSQEEPSKESVSKLLSKAPDWSIGVIVYKGSAYPLAKSKFVKDEYYFSPSWRPIVKDVESKDVIVLKSGEIKKYKVRKKGEKYIQVIPA